MIRERISRAIDQARAAVLAALGRALLSCWSRTIRLRFVNREVPKALEAAGRNFIYAFWHGRQFILFQAHRGSGVVIPASESRDGEIQARILKHFGFEVVRGSSKRKGERALLGLVDALRSGKSIALAVDGPRGPVYEVKQGVTYLAGKLDKPIVPVTMGAKRGWTLERVWDKYLLPRPFTECVVVYGEPLTVAGTDVDMLERMRRELAAAINRTMDQADRYFAPAPERRT